MQAFSQSLDTDSLIRDLARKYYMHAIRADSVVARPIKPSYYVTPTDRSHIVYQIPQSNPDPVKSNSKTPNMGPRIVASTRGATSRTAVIKKEEETDDQTILYPGSSKVGCTKKEEETSIAVGNPNNPYVLRVAKWNIPSWGNGGDGSWAYPFARAESLCDRPPTIEWDRVRKTGRCIIICDGYFANLTTTKGKKKVKVMCFVRYADKRPMILAGLLYVDEDDGIPYRFCVITAEKPKYSLYHEVKPTKEEKEEARKRKQEEKERLKQEKAKMKQDRKGKKKSVKSEPIDDADPLAAAPVEEKPWTTQEKAKKLHLPGDRVPVILPTPEAAMTWLDTSSRRFEDRHRQLLQPHINHEAPLVWYEVEGDSRSDPHFIEPAEDPDQGVEENTDSESASESDAE